MCNKHVDHLKEGIPCAFFNFKGQYQLEAKIRKILSEKLDATDDTHEATRKTVDAFKLNGIEKVVWVYDGYALFWYIGD